MTLYQAMARDWLQDAESLGVNVADYLDEMPEEVRIEILKLREDLEWPTL